RLRRPFASRESRQSGKVEECDEIWTVICESTQNAGAYGERAPVTGTMMVVVVAVVAVVVDCLFAVVVAVDSHWGTGPVGGCSGRLAAGRWVDGLQTCRRRGESSGSRIRGQGRATRRRRRRGRCIWARTGRVVWPHTWGRRGAGAAGSDEQQGNITAASVRCSCSGNAGATLARTPDWPHTPAILAGQAATGH
ncbi:hypothetical protein EJ04DRAFT_608319, partial [Polyplosphaeria fusca]